MTKDRFIELASEFRKTKLWEYLTDSDVFGITLQDGRIAYCCVMGNSGIHKGLGSRTRIFPWLTSTDHA